MMKSIAASLIALFAATVTHAVDWPQEMGPDRSGYTPERIALGRLTPETEPAWVVNAGMGAAPPAVVDGRVYVTGYFHREADLSDGIQDADRARFAKGNQVAQNVAYPRSGAPGKTDMIKGISQGGPGYYVDEYALCFDLEEGRLLWTRRIQDEVVINHYYFTRATPLVRDGMVYIHTFNARLFGLDAADGKIAWQQDLYHFGGATLGKGGNWCGPLYADGKVVVMYAEDKKTTRQIAVDPRTGDEKWLTVVEESSFRPAKSSITLGEVDGKPTIVQSCGHYTVGLNPENGERRWVFDYKKEFNVPDDLSGTGSKAPGYSWRITWPGRIPFVRNGIVLDSQMVGYKNDWAFTYAFTVENGKIRQLWHQKFPLRCFGQFVVKGDYLYGLDQMVLGGRPESRNRPDDMGAFQCVNIRTGEKPWITPELDEMVDYGSLKDGNPHYIMAGDDVIFHQHDGLIVGKATPEQAGPFRKIEMDDYAARGLAMPVVAGGHLLVRRLGGRVGMHRDEAMVAEERTLVCFDLRKD